MVVNKSSLGPPDPAQGAKSGGTPVRSAHHQAIYLGDRLYKRAS